MNSSICLLAKDENCYINEWLEWVNINIIKKGGDEMKRFAKCGGGKKKKKGGR